MENREKFNNNENKEQTPEQIRAILIEVSDEKLNIFERPHVDLIITPLGTESEDVPDLIVDEVKGGVVYMTYIDNGELGELIPLEISRIKKATII